MSSAWGYGPDNGPGTWHREFPVALEGKRQSPIDIKTDDVVDAKHVTIEKPLKWEYGDQHCLSLENTGHSWKVNVDGNGSALTGGPLDSEYELWQFHAHWGSENSKGSEHSIDGEIYPAELHFVHWNRSKYPSPNVAAGEPDGLCVLGLLLAVGEANPELEKVIRILDKVEHRDEKVVIDEPVNPTKILPRESKSAEIWVYDGSLTTPPLLESVIWILFRKAISISQEQLDQMRKLKFNNGEDKKQEHMVDNFRPPVPLGERAVRAM